MTANGSSPESWRPVAGARFYRVTSRGRVWSILGRQFLALTPNNKGYLRVKYTDDTGCRVTRAIGPMVLEHFAGPRPPGMECCHGPGGKTDNRWPENIRWDTPEANLRDRYGDWRECRHCHGSGRVYVA